ncbi:MAG: NUDIX hydrolase [Candidatus Roizmanbacteria bacterium]
MKQTQLVVNAVVIYNDKILLTKRNEDKEDSKFHNLWQLPGGGLEFGETPEQTLHREMKEECGIDVKITSLFPKIYTEQRNYWQGVFIIYICEMIDVSQKIIINDEATEYGWFNNIEIAKLELMPMLENALSEIASYLKS